tara:strand:- start:2560 stop:2694 length:135 start_codon:yes stop_codon:yes gene_type:complete
MVKTVKRTRNPIARKVKTPRYRKRVIQDKKKKMKRGYSKYVAYT